MDDRDILAGRVQVLVVDDQPPFRAAARAVISRVEGFDLIGESASGEEAVVLAEQLCPDLVLMDINMGAMDGIEATRRITTTRPETLVILDRERLAVLAAGHHREDATA